MIRIHHSVLTALAKGLGFLPHCSRTGQQRRGVFSTAAALVERNSRRALGLGLVVSLLATSTPAASQTIIGVTQEWHASLGFWLRANHVPAKLYRALSWQNPEGPKPQEKQEDRDARVSRIQIYPGDVTIQEGERVNFTAVAYDNDDSAVGGVSFTWSAKDQGRNRETRISKSGDFEATVTGDFKLTVEGAGRKDSVKVNVLEGKRHRKSDDQPRQGRTISSRDNPAGVSSGLKKNDSKRARALTFSESAALRHAGNQKLRAHAVMPVLPEDGWGESNYWSADDPGNQRGNPSGAPLDGGAGSANFQFAAPLLGLPGRGIDISLGLAGNSRLWNKAGTVMNYDIDRDWPAPGFALGFGKLFGMGGGSMLIDADGTRHTFTGVLTPYSWGSEFIGHTTDGSLIDYLHQTNTVGWIITGQAKLANGTVIQYGAHGPGGVFPTRITDPNGNYITITYVNNAGPQIQTVTDTLGRVINFYYDANNLLTAITAPGLDNGAARTLARLHYKHQSLNYNFSTNPTLTPVVRDSNPWVIDAIYYPGTATGYWFGDSDSYSTYGMLAKVVEQRGMGFSASSLTEQGTVTQGQMTRKEVYNYPLYVGDTSGTASSNLSDAPTYTSMTETWTRDGVNTDQATTTYNVQQNANPRTVTITLPNGTTSTQKSYNAPGQFNDGLVFQDETRDAVNTLLQSSSATWALGAYDTPRPTHVEATNDRQQTTATDFIYGSAYNQVIEVRNYDYGASSLLRSTHTQYQNSSNYTNRHIFNLPSVVEVYGPDNVTRLSRTEYQYDGQTLNDAPSVVMHDEASNPYDPLHLKPGPCHNECDMPEPPYCVTVCDPDYMGNEYIAATDYRGNVTQTTTYADALNLGGAITETRRYDITGNMIKASTSCCQQTTFSYTLATQFAYPLSQTRGSDTDPYKQVTTSATYDFNTGLVMTAADANGRTSWTSYFASTLRPQSAMLPSNARTEYAYDDSAMSVTQTTYLAVSPSDTGAMADQNVKLLNGRGQVRQEKALGAGSVWDLVDTAYDNMGRVSQQTRPYRSGDTLQWTNIAYDALSRTTRVTAPDGSVTETYYNERDFDISDGYVPTRPNVVSGTAPGETTLVRDAWGRERWGRTDAQGRLIEVVEPNPSGSGSVATGGLVTTYAYNTLGNLTSVLQYATQTRSFKYDSLGRLTAQKLAETSATLNDAGTYVGSGTWSDVFTYDDRSNLTSRTDARGVKTVYSYSSDPLNRLQSVSWDTSGFGDTANPILSSATVSYQYRTKSSGSQLLDITQLSSVATSGVSAESYVYDSEGRVSSKTVTLTSRPSYPFVTDYIFDTLDRITDVRYPAEYGNGTQPRKLVHHDYDVASRLTGLTVDGATHASQIVYNAASQTTSLKVGTSGANQITENYGYHAQTGLLDNQTVARGATTLLNLSYDYANPSGKRTGQLTKILNNLNHNRDRGYTYDALGRLTQATGGPSTGALWTQTYSYDNFGNRTSVSASGYSARNRGSSPTVMEGLAQNADAGSPGILPATSALSVPPAVAGGSSAAIAQPGDPQVSLPTEQLAAKTDINSPDSTRTNTSRSTSKGHHASRTTSPTPQGGPPVFTDPDLLAAGGVIVKAIHITELRTAINDLRARMGISAYSWTTSVAGPIKADPILEMRTALDQALGPPSPAYAAGLAQNLPILAIHIQELRNRVVAAWNTPIQIPRDGHASLSYDATTNRITTAGFVYDKAGNQVRALIAGGGSQRFQYDAANRLVKVKADDNVTVLATYTYGDSNERLIAEEGGLRTYFACDASAEYVESGGSTTPQWSKTYIYLGARLLSTLTPNGSGGEAVQHHHPDRLGTRLITDPSNGTSFEQVTLPFGTALNAESTGSTNRRFTSYSRSTVTGLDYANNRHYDAQQGRFTQVDPIGMSASSLSNPQSLNMYNYCASDPINRTDPTGLFWGKLWRAIKKVLTSKWFVIALSVALAVITIGSSVFGWSLAKAVMTSLGDSGFGVPILVPTGQSTATALGWVASGIQAAQAISNISFSARAILRNIVGFAAGIGLSRVLSSIPIGSIGPGGTPGFNPNAGYGFQGNSGLAEAFDPKRDGISDCVKKLLGPWFSELVLNNIRLVQGIPRFVRGDANGFTDGGNVIFLRKIDQQTSTGIALIGHELTHVRQSKRFGSFWFTKYYAQNSWREWRAGRDPAGRGNPLEKEAYDMEDAIKTDLEKHFGSKNPCP
jgi:RHS repeat-associated protein